MWGDGVICGAFDMCCGVNVAQATNGAPELRPVTTWTAATNTITDAKACNNDSSVCRWAM